MGLGCECRLYESCFGFVKIRERWSVQTSRHDILGISHTIESIHWIEILGEKHHHRDIDPAQDQRHTGSKVLPRTLLLQACRIMLQLI